jgi:hypothetical protein
MVYLVRVRRVYIGIADCKARIYGIRRIFLDRFNRFHREHVRLVGVISFRLIRVEVVNI